MSMLKAIPAPGVSRSACGNRTNLKWLLPIWSWVYCWLRWSSIWLFGLHRMLPFLRTSVCKIIRNKYLSLSFDKVSHAAKNAKIAQHHHTNFQTNNQASKQTHNQTKKQLLGVWSISATNLAQSAPDYPLTSPMIGRKPYCSPNATCVIHNPHSHAFLYKLTKGSKPLHEAFVSILCAPKVCSFPINTYVNSTISPLFIQMLLCLGSHSPDSPTSQNQQSCHSILREGEKHPMIVPN